MGLPKFNAKISGSSRGG
jgi:hypothetical protein